VLLALGFTPSKRIEIDYAGRSTFIPPDAHPALTVPGSGILSVDAHGTRGDVSYGVRIVPRSG
jgi:hypothetical protein